MFNNIVESCQFLLNNFPAAQECKEYIEARLNDESRNLFQFGYFPEGNNISALTSLIGEDNLEKLKLCYFRDIEDSMSPRKLMVSYFDNYPLILPYKDPYGNIVALVGRTLIPEDERKKLNISKYKNTKFKKSAFIYGLFENKKYILEQDSVFLVEGQIDVIKAAEVGLRNVLAIGSASLSSYQFSVITRYTNNIFLLLDNDDAGDNGRRLIMNKFGRYANIRNFYIPENYKDIDEYISKENITSSEQIVFLLKDF